MKFISKTQLKEDNYRAISDFISGMTDRYAINLYNKIKMNIFENYLEKIKKILLNLSKQGKIFLPEKLNGITAEIPPSKFNCDISTNVAMVLSKINNTSPIDLANILTEQLKK